MPAQQVPACLHCCAAPGILWLRLCRPGAQSQVLTTAPHCCCCADHPLAALRLPASVCDRGPHTSSQTRQAQGQVGCTWQPSGILIAALQKPFAIVLGQLGWGPWSIVCIRAARISQLRYTSSAPCLQHRQGQHSTQGFSCQTTEPTVLMPLPPSLTSPPSAPVLPQVCGAVWPQQLRV
jgi:hypothetical protein